MYHSLETPALQAPGPLRCKPAHSAARRELWQLGDGACVTLRPVMPQDSAGLGALFARLTPQSRRNRFHACVNQVPLRWLDQMCCVDPTRHVAFVMTTARGEQEHIVADARYVVEAGAPGDGAEFAIVVDEDWRRRGLGERALRVLCQQAASTGLHWLYGEVLAHNQPMLGLMQKSHFCCTPHREDEALVVVQTRLALANPL
jgi:acetyltransferase